MNAERVDEMLSKFEELSEASFEEWIGSQPDSKELVAEFLDLMTSPPTNIEESL